MEALESVVLVYNSTPWPRLKSKPGNQIFWGLRDLNRNILIPYKPHTMHKIQILHMINLTLKKIADALLLCSCPVVSDSFWPQGLQHSRSPCPSPSPRVCPSSCSFHWCCHPAISSSDALFSFCPQSFPASGTLPMNLLLVSINSWCEHQSTMMS